jgi:hypothetical protein
MRTFNLKKCLKEIEVEKYIEPANKYFEGINYAVDVAIKIILRNIQEKSLTSAGNELLDQAAIDKVIQKRHFK